MNSIVLLNLLVIVLENKDTSRWKAQTLTKTRIKVLIGNKKESPRRNMHI